MRALTVSPGIANSRSSKTWPTRRRPTARCWCARWRSACAAPTAKSSPATMAGRRQASGGWCSGHESLGRVEEAPAGSGVALGDHVVGIVRRPDPVPCPACAVGEWDMCRNGRYTERGIKERHGYRRRALPRRAGIRWCKVDPALGMLGVLMEPASILAKAWEHIERIGRRARCGSRGPCWSPAPARSGCWPR